ncbi:multi-sensor hybrid histidine kinase [Candidatus Paraburkholderia kirkii]|nr:multi-sensor hybrid histidine kinase [Candidatus Paraburkholderia kirkii]
MLEGDALVRVAAWALPDEESAPRRIARGEGLVGQAIADARVLELRDASAHYLRTGSALGSATASRVVIAPVYADGEVAGAVELGFVGGEGRFDDARTLLEMASEPVGMALRSARYRARLVELLEETLSRSCCRTTSRAI